MSTSADAPQLDDRVDRWIEPFVAGKANSRAHMAGVRDQRPDYRQKVTRLAEAYADTYGRPMRVADLFGPAPETLLRTFRDARMKETAPLRATSRNAYRRVVNAFVTFLHEAGLVGAERVPWKMEKMEASTLRTFRPDDIQRMFMALNEQDSIANRRLAAQMAMAIDHGARRGDALSARLSKLHLDGRRARLSVKNGKEIEVPLSEFAVRALCRYLEVRFDAGHHDTVFLTTDGTGPMSGNAVGAAFRRLLRRLGMVKPVAQRQYDDCEADPERLNFQTLRRTFVRYYLQAGRSERELIAILGWDPKYAHQVYEHYISVGINELAAVHEEASPLSRMLRGAA